MRLMLRAVICVVVALSLVGVAHAAPVDPGWNVLPPPLVIQDAGTNQLLPRQQTRHAGCRWVVIPPGPKGPGGVFYVC